ncbi:MAG: DUF2085 domain-containing protein [Methanomassiliicoccales archaeon]
MKAKSFTFLIPFPFVIMSSFDCMSLLNSFNLILQSSSGPVEAWADLLWEIGYALCHQISSRSLFMGGMQFPVCARDTGTMLGFGIVLLFFIFNHRKKRSGLPDIPTLIVCAFGLMIFAFDGVSSYLGFRETNNEWRLTSGLIMGLSLGIMLLTVMARLLGGKEDKRCFTFKDLFILAPFFFLAYFATKIDLGGLGWYLISSFIIISLISLILIIMQIFLRSILWGKKEWSEQRIMLFSVILTAGTIFLLWLFHRLTETSIPH